MKCIMIVCSMYVYVLVCENIPRDHNFLLKNNNDDYLRIGRLRWPEIDK